MLQRAGESKAGSQGRSRSTGRRGRVAVGPPGAGRSRPSSSGCRRRGGAPDTAALLGPCNGSPLEAPGRPHISGLRIMKTGDFHKHVGVTEGPSQTYFQTPKGVVGALLTLSEENENTDSEGHLPPFSVAQFPTACSTGQRPSAHHLVPWGCAE